MARNKRFKDAKGKREGGGFIALPHIVIRSNSFCLLSPYAIKLLFDLLSQFNGGNNGDPLGDLAKELLRQISEHKIRMEMVA